MLEVVTEVTYYAQGCAQLVLFSAGSALTLAMPYTYAKKERRVHIFRQIGGYKGGHWG